jgi:hypothetical protein
MKKFKKSVKWNARVRMYAVDHTYEEKILPPHGRASLTQGLRVGPDLSRPGCGIRYYMIDCFGIK